MKQKRVLFLLFFYSPFHRKGRRRCGAKITPRGGEVWLISSSKVAMMLHSTNGRPRKRFHARCSSQRIYKLNVNMLEPIRLVAQMVSRSMRWDTVHAHPRQRCVSKP